MIGPIKLSAQFDAGFLINPMRPADGLNFGHLFTDHANQAQLNQVLLTASKPLDPKDSGSGTDMAPLARPSTALASCNTRPVH